MIFVILGAQFGSEGKGKATSILAQRLAHKSNHSPIVVRTGGPNAGHTVRRGDLAFKFRQIPAAAFTPSATLVIPPAGIIDVDLLFKEIDELESHGLNIRDRLYIDPNATILEPWHSEEEYHCNLTTRLGSTATGTGSAQAGKVMRTAKIARDIPDLAPFLLDVPLFLNSKLDTDIIIETTQGFGLSLHASGNYPMTTSRDITASQALADCGLPPQHVNTYLVLRTFPIRVGGNSGPLPGETTWENVASISGYASLGEYTTVTGRLRRVAEFDSEVMQRAVNLNNPTGFIVHGLDYLNASNRGVHKINELTVEATEFMNMLKRKFNVGIPLVFTGPDDLDHIWTHSQPLEQEEFNFVPELKV